MLNWDDEEFESYLKTFKPAAPTALPKSVPRRYRLIEPPALWGSIAASLILLIAGLAVWQVRPYRGAGRRMLEPVSVNGKPPLPPLTIGSANRWLAAAPSADAALDDLAFRAKNAAIPAGKKSALAVLREENTKL